MQRHRNGLLDRWSKGLKMKISKKPIYTKALQIFRKKKTTKKFAKNLKIPS